MMKKLLIAFIVLIGPFIFPHLASAACVVNPSFAGAFCIETYQGFNTCIGGNPQANSACFMPNTSLCGQLTTQSACQTNYLYCQCDARSSSCTTTVPLQESPCAWVANSPTPTVTLVPTSTPIPLTCLSTCSISIVRGVIHDPCVRATNGCNTCSNQSGGIGQCIGPTSTPRPTATPSLTPSPTLTPTYYISGGVYDVTTGTPLLYTGGNATIKLCTLPSCGFVSPLDPQIYVTNGFGTYKFNNVKSGTYYVQIIPPATYIVQKPINPFNEFTVTVGSGCNVIGTGASCVP